MKPKVLYYRMLNFQPESLNLLKTHFDLIEVQDPEDDNPDIWQQIDATFAPLGFYCGRQKIDACPHLKAIVSNTTGDPHIDVKYAKSRGIKVITLKNEQPFLGTITPTAEHTWGLLLALTRRIPWAFQSVAGGVWNRRLFPGQAMLSSLSLGIIGLGRLGTMVARYGRCFGMAVQFYDPYVPAPDDGKVTKVRNLVDLVAGNDVISLHAPHNDDTAGMLDRRVFQNFKPGAYFINTARAEIVDFKALLEALEDGTLAGAAMDVFEGEFIKGFSGSRKFARHPLLDYARNNENLLITPHIGGSTYDAWRRTEMRVTDRLIDAIG